MRRPYFFSGFVLLIAAILVGFAIRAEAKTAVEIFNGGTGTSTAPAYGQVLIGGNNGEYEFVASSTLGSTAVGFSTTSAAYWLTQQSTSNLTEGSNLYFTNARAISALTGQSNTLFTNGAGYLTSLAGAASSTLLKDNNTFFGNLTAATTTTTSLNGTIYVSGSILGYPQTQSGIQAAVNVCGNLYPACKIVDLLNTDTTVDTNGITVPANVTVTSSASSTLGSYADNVNKNGIFNVTADNVTISHINFNVGFGGSAVTQYGGSNLTLQFNDFTGTTTNFLVWYDGYSVQGGTSTSTNYRIDHNDFHDAPNTQAAIVFQTYTYGMSNPQLTYNTFTHTGGPALSINSTATTTGLLVDHNVVTDTYTTCSSTFCPSVILFAGIDSAYKITDTMFSNNYYRQSSTTINGSGGIWIYQAYNTKIINNTFIGADHNAPSTFIPNSIAIAPGRINGPDKGLIIQGNYTRGFGAAWDPDSMEDTDVSGNVVGDSNSCYNLGYNIQKNVHIHHNICRNSSQGGPYDTAVQLGCETMTNDVIENNKYYDTSASSSMKSAFALICANDYSTVVLRNNIFYSPTATSTALFYNDGSSTQPLDYENNQITDSQGVHEASQYLGDSFNFMSTTSSSKVLVGIGTTSPGTILALRNTANFDAATSTLYSDLRFNNINNIYFDSSAANPSPNYGLIWTENGVQNPSMSFTYNGSGTGNTGNYLAWYNLAGGSTELTRLQRGGNLGIGTTSPGSILSVGNNSGINFTTATSTFATGSGINLTGGCFAISGTCLTQNSGTITSIIAGTGLSGGTITTSGTISLSAPVSIANGGTATTTAGNSSGIEYYNGSTFTNSNKLLFDGTNLDVGTGSGFGNNTILVAEKDSSGATTYPFYVLNNGGAAPQVGIELGTYNSWSVAPPAAIIGIDDNFSDDLGFYSKSQGSASNAAVQRFIIGANGNNGFGTTTPSALLSLAGTTGILASTTATSTFIGGGINLITGAGNTGCFAVNGTCLTQNSGTVTSIATNNGITGGTITTIGTLSLDQTFGAVWTAASSTYTNHLSLNTASSTQFSSPTIWDSTVGNALWLGDANGKATAYAGSSNPCAANQAPTTLSALGALGGCTSTFLTGNQSITLTGDVTGSGATAITTAFNLANSHWWTATQNFTQASTSMLTATSSVWFTGITSSRLLAVDNNGMLVASTSISTNLLAANGVSAGSYTNANITVGANGIVTAASNGSSGSTWPFTSATNDGQSVQSTTTAEWFQTTPFALMASGTIDVSGSSGAYAIDEATVLQASSTNKETAVGQSALAIYFNTTATAGETALGFQALGNATSSVDDTAVGYQALKGDATVSNTGSNTGVGYQALTINTSGNSNVAIGALALSNNKTGNNDVAVGFNALKIATSSTGNTVVGREAGQNISGATGVVGISNTLIGHTAGFGITTGSNNTIIGGSNTGTSQNEVTTGSNNISLGYNVAVASPTLSNQLSIGNEIYGTGLSGAGLNPSNGAIGIGTTTPWGILSVGAPVAGNQNPLFVVASSTPSATTTAFIINASDNVGIGTSTPWTSLVLGSGTIFVPELTLATSTNMSVGIASSSQQLVQYSTSAVTINISNFDLIAGAKTTLVTCNPGSTAGGTITFTNLHYSGGVQPGNTTQAGTCDMWYISVTNGELGSSTEAV